MKTHEIIKFLRRLETEPDESPMAGPALRLRTKLRSARMAYEDEVGLGAQPSERRCGICGVAVSQCCC